MTLREVATTGDVEGACRRVLALLAGTADQPSPCPLSLWDWAGVRSVP